MIFRRPRTFARPGEISVSYRCQVCRAAVPAGLSRLVYTVYRPTGNPPRKETEREVPVCRSCHKALCSGTLPLQVRALAAAVVTVFTAAAKAVPLTATPTPKSGVVGACRPTPVRVL